MKDKKSQKVFSCFLRTSFNDALILFLNSGQKSQLKTVKSIIKKIFKFCDENADFTDYIRYFVRFEIVQSGLLTINNMKDDPTKSVI